MMTLTSTYDHRVIQGATSGEFLRRVHQLLLGADGFYDEIFQSLRIPYEPIRWAQDISVRQDDDADRQPRGRGLVRACRVRGHPPGSRHRPEYRQRAHPDRDIASPGLTLWDPDRESPVGPGGKASGKRFMTLREIPGIRRASYVRTM